ncbi:MAG: HAMP domain-containing protein, partial [Actinobacteria bacterium]
MSLRHRLVGAIVVIGLVLVIAGVAVAGLIRGALIDQVDQQLARATPPLGVLIGGSQAGVPVGPTDILGPAPGGESGERFTELYVAVGSSDGIRVFGPTYGEDAPPDLVEVMPTAGTQVEGREFTTVDAVGGDGPRYRVLIEGVPGGGTIAVARSLRDTDNTYQQIVTVEIIAFLAVLLTLAVAGWWLLRHGVRPLDKMAATANAIADGDLSRRVEPAEAATEVGRLGIALNTMLGQIEEAFDERQESEDRLRRFVADASH